jgi:hypothetical protein
MREGWLLLFLTIVIILSGCTTSNQHSQFQYSNNIITIEDYSVATTNPYPSTSTYINFWVKSSGDHPTIATVDFFNVPNNLNAQLSCDNVPISGKLSCDIPLEPFDSKPVKLDLTMPSDNILSPIPYTIALSVSYNWTGYRSANIPIIDGVVRTRPVSQFVQSTPTYGPIVVDFTPPVGITYKQGNQVITERWGSTNRPFEIDMNFRHVGTATGAVSIYQPVKIPANQIKLSMQNIEIPPSVYCAFDNTTMLYPRDLELPGTIVCLFRNSTAALAGEITGAIAVNYTYTYIFTKTETIIEQPIPQ